MSQLRVAMIAPPWLPIPPHGYGGIEAVLYSLCRDLRKLDVKIELFSIGDSHIRGIKTHSLYKSEQYSDIHKPTYESIPINFAHLQFALNYIERDGKFDIIHDHNGFVGPSVLAYAAGQKGIPPVVHTLHGPPFSNQQMIDSGLPDNRPFWDQLGKSGKPVYFVPISETLKNQAPKSLKPRMLDAVHNAVDPKQFPFRDRKHDYFLTLARFAADKGQHVAAELCDQLGYKLRMAGTVAGIATKRQLLLELTNPLSAFRNAADFRYYSDQVWSYTVNNPNIQFIGNISSQHKLTTIANARALLFPINWEEPFGMAVIEALACGTPVIAMRRGAMSEIIEHGVTGFLADSVEEFREYMLRIDEIDPAACRRAVEERFSSSVMAQRYLERYLEVLKHQS